MEDTQNLTPPENQVEPEKAIPEKEGAQVEAEPEKGKVETPTPRMFTEEEHKQVLETLKGGHKGTVSKMRGEIEQLTTKLAELESQRSELEYSNWLRAVEEKGGDVDFAKQVVAMDKKVRQTAAQIAAKERALSEKEVALNEAAIGKTAYDLLKEHGLGEETLETLINEASGKSAAEGKLAMENLALRLSIKSQRAKAVPPVVTDKGGGKPAPLDLSHLSESEATGRALDEAIRSRH